MKEHKTDMNITKIDKYKKTKQKLNSNSNMEHQTPEHYQIQKNKTKTEQQFYYGAPNT